LTAQNPVSKDVLLSPHVSLPGPSFTGAPLLAQRVAGLLNSAAVPATMSTLPTSAEEIWRYSRVDQCDLGQFAAPVVGDASDTTTWSVPSQLESGVRHGDAVTDADGIGSLVADDFDAFVLRSLINATDVTVIDVRAGLVVEEPIVVHRHIRADGTTVGSRLRIIARPNSDVTIIERVTSDDVASLVVPITEITLESGARVRMVTVQELGPRMWQVAMMSSDTAADATLSTMAVSLGGYYARLRTDAKVTGKGGHNELLAVYFGEAEQMHDFRTIQEHIAPKTTSELVFKGAVEDASRSVYSGLIKIGVDARGTSANQTNRNLLLSPNASAESVPNLEIENNDVKCSHASAVGPIDDDHRYYLESRGVPPDIAERLIVLGFFRDLLDRIPDEVLRGQLFDEDANEHACSCLVAVKNRTFIRATCRRRRRCRRHSSNRHCADRRRRVRDW
jgi:Fe-S cluster assembly protein SufD